MAGVVVLALVVLTLVVLTLVVLALVVQVLVVLVLVVLVPLLLSLHAAAIAGLGEAKFIIGNDDIRLVASRSANIGCQVAGAARGGRTAAPTQAGQNVRPQLLPGIIEQVVHNIHRC